MAAAPTTIGALLHEHSTNPVKDTLMESSSNKQWAKEYHPIKQLVVHTQAQSPGVVVGTFDRAFLGEYDDENLRLDQPAYPPNYRNWRMNTEQDAIAWFNAEVSNVVLSAFSVYPGVMNCAHEKPLSSTRTDETVDTSYSIDANGGRTNLAIGEFKRGTLKRARWQTGSLGSGQESLSREFRGYAHKYECPHIFCFDGYTLLLLQFRAKSPDEIKDAKCVVDCWVFPRDNLHGTPLRYALYRFLVQGFRRCQGMRATNMSLYGIRPTLRLFYSGLPLWKMEDGNFYANPWGHERKLEASCGAFYWTGTDGNAPLLDGGDNLVWDTDSFWQTPTQQLEGDSVPMVVEDFYPPDALLYPTASDIVLGVGPVKNCPRPEWVSKYRNMLPDDYCIIFAHADLSWENILVDPTTGSVTGIVDWEMAGFWPEWWEYRKALFGSRPRQWWIDILKQIMKEYQPETETDMELEMF